MHTPSSPPGPAQPRRKLAVACILALSAGASLASSPPQSDIVAGSADGQPFTIDGSHKLQEFTVVVDANAAAVPRDVQRSGFDVELTLTVAENASGPAEVVVIPEAGVTDQAEPISLGVARGEMRRVMVTSRGAFDRCRHDETCTRGITVTVKHVAGGAVSVAPSAHASIVWAEDDKAPKSAQVVVTYVDLQR